MLLYARRSLKGEATQLFASCACDGYRKSRVGQLILSSMRCPVAALIRWLSLSCIRQYQAVFTWRILLTTSLCSFDKYVDRAEATVLSEHQAVDHWAKIEVGRMPPNKLQQKLAARYPVADFNAARAALDPKNILSNPLLDVMFPRTDV